MRRPTQGFTLLELLVASAIALFLLTVVGTAITSTLKLQARENQNVPVQQALRASVEVIAQELRDAIGPKIIYTDMNGTGVTLPTALRVSSNTVLTILVPQPNSTFTVTQPVGYPGNIQVAARTSTIIDEGSVTDSAAVSQPCSNAFSGSEFGVLYSTLSTTFQSNASRAPNAFRVFQAAPSLPCVGIGPVVLNHPATPLPALNWNPNTYMVEVSPITYYVDTSTNTLYRQLAGQTAQVVAYGISSMAVTYLPDNTVAGLANCSTPGTFTTVPGCAPRSINLTLTSIPQKAAVTGAQSLTASQIIFLR